MNYADWGPADLSVFGTAAFPADALLYYQSNAVTKASGYDVRPVNAVDA